ncbi:AAA family ATPase [Gimesia sp.]|uniref:AAA family ATPase n=1 Tax=Gimesia sp. TaxID=2024833 RepID=UPI000C6554C5|nr:AAA family ATPase [Gimesia sp.]MAX35351.1 AAA family ATPase [Gimesia sp.]HAH46710.1 AAA family ATPase [Planctomycetaceae bacterium]HBL47856.1 AAA family ATPase [Planctomycetaceae bacterium]|tara:strand:- start:4128 stop:5552 length:1425 start_codon:yes stop_codon:yes gene_type:complete
MRIDKLHLTNFRRFKEHSMKLAPQFNLIVGDNTSGKTAILDALSIAASAVVAGRRPEISSSRSIKDSDVRQQSFLHVRTVTWEPQFPCIVSCNGEINGEQGGWEFARDSEGKMNSRGAQWAKDKINAVRKHVMEGGSDPLPLVCYYGTERLWRQTNIKSTRDYMTKSRLIGYKQCLNPASDETLILEWFRDQEFASLQRKVEIPLLEACRRAISTCIRNCKHVYFDAVQKQMVMIVEDTALPLTFFSDGYRNMLSMVADIAIRCVTLNPQLGSEAALETSGVVLIDELDLHLHPKWQREVIPDLMSAFPRIQFIATTHSPFVIQSLPPTPEVQLVNLDDQLNQSIENKSIEDIAEEIQGVEIPQQSRRFLDMMEKAQEYFSMLQDDSIATASDKDAVRDELEKTMMPYSDNPAYQALLRMHEIAVESLLDSDKMSLSDSIFQKLMDGDISDDFNKRDQDDEEEEGGTELTGGTP